MPKGGERVALTVTAKMEWKPVEYDYESEYTMIASYSATARAKCRRCGDLIPKVRLSWLCALMLHGLHQWPTSRTFFCVQVDVFYD